MRKTFQWGAICALALALFSFGAFAQTTGGGIQGKVTDEAGQPVVGATIQISGQNLPGQLGAVTDLEGIYRIPYLPVGKAYTVKVEASGYNTVVRKGIDVSLGSTVSLPFTLAQGTTTVNVVGSAPVVDNRRTETGATISDTMVSAIPLDRNASNIAFLAPSAVQSGLADTPSFGGASGPENAYIVNGVDVTGAGDALNLTSLNFDFIEATEVKTGGMDAEWGAVMGGTVNSITRSGSNEFHGGAYMYYWDDGLGSSEKKINNPTVVNYIKSQKIWDIGAFVGGYFVKDKLWFFAAYDYNKEEREETANATDANVLLNGRPGYSWAAADGYKNTYKDPQYAFKLTWNVNQDHRLVFSFFGNDSKDDIYRNANNLNPTASPYSDKVRNYAASLQWNATWTPKFFTEAIVSRRYTKRDLVPKNSAALNNWRYYYMVSDDTYGGYQVVPTGDPISYDSATGQINLSSWAPSLGGGTIGHVKDINDQIRLKGTNLFNLGGRHELSYGFQYYNIKYDENFNYTGPSVTELHPDDPYYGMQSAGGATVMWRYYWRDRGNQSLGKTILFRAQYFMNDQNKKTKQKYYAYWIQDNYNITDYFMLKVGIRLDQIDMKGGINSNSDLTIGPSRSMKIKDEWAPRIGFTWDVAHNNKSKLYGFWGRYYERIPNDLAIRALTSEFFHFGYYFDAALTQPTNWTGNYSGSDNYTYGYDPTIIAGGHDIYGNPDPGKKLKGAYNDEAILGFQYEIAPDFSVGARAIYRYVGRVIEDISADGANQYYVTNPDKWTDVWVPDVYNSWAMWRFPKPVRIYRALEITADKRFSNNWQMGGSYVLSRLKGNYEGLFSNDNGQLDPNITSKYDIPSLLKNGYGLLPNDRTHNIKVYGSYRFPTIPLDLNGGFYMISGTPISKLGTEEAYGTNEGFCAVRGTAGRTPTTYQFDLGAQYTFKLFNSNLALRADIFNVTNEQRTTSVVQTYNSVDCSNVQTYPYFKKELTHQRARRIRLAVRWTF